MTEYHEAARAAHSVNRRQMLRGLGTLMSLPFLESLGGRAFAAAAPAAAKAPLRAAWLYIPNGVNTQQWFPTGEGANYELSASLKTLEKHRNDFMVISGLAQDKARSHGNGGGDHARATSTFLTGCMPKKTAGADIQAGVSVDQIAAQKIGHLTRLSSLELSTDGQRSSGRCDSGYSCAYQFNLAWKSETMPMAPEMDPRLVFERMFGYGSSGARGAEGARRQRMQKSILDTVLGEAKSLQNQVNLNDRRKLDEYFSSVRDIETRIERAEKFTAQLPDVKIPDGIPDSYEEHIRTMFDLLVLAFQTDTTRLSTFMLAHDGSNRSFPEIGVPDAHHYLSHHESDPQKLDKIAKIDQFYLRQFSYFLDKMKAVKESDGSNLLDNSMIVFGGGIGDGNKHNHDNLPILMAGRGAGTLTPGKRVVLPGETPMTNLYLSMLDRMGVHAERVGDSTGTLEVS